MNTNEMREKSVAELKQELQALLKEQFNLRMQKGMGEMPRVHLFKQVRRSIARIKTIINQKERPA
ncbi:MAG: 50S ribosomal protein L29 [Gammaproteobacteria bacterium]|nr:50S ribosomal protein L29 [Gammaproteobacteria bacterium]MCH9744868.1 50S ribosomal protein L29 [Gammaproteobacteria bacterium]